MFKVSYTTYHLTLPVFFYPPYLILQIKGWLLYVLMKKFTGILEQFSTTYRDIYELKKNKCVYQSCHVTLV